MEKHWFYDCKKVEDFEFFCEENFVLQKRFFSAMETSACGVRVWQVNCTKRSTF